eukprot:2125188-Amphidinium_carterae.1
MLWFLVKLRFCLQVVAAGWLQSDGLHGAQLIYPNLILAAAVVAKRIHSTCGWPHPRFGSGYTSGQTVPTIDCSPCQSN